MKEIADYLLKNYYSKYKGPRKDIVPTKELLIKALDICREKVIVIQQDGIQGVGIYCTLSDETYSNITKLDIAEVEVLTEMLREKGHNVHFFLVAGSDVKNILLGIRIAKEKENAKTISWWNPSMTKLHRYTVRKEK